MNYERHPWKENLIVEMEIPSLKDLLKKMETIRKEAKTVMERTKEIMKRQYNKRTCQSQNRRTSMARGKKYSNKPTLKKAGPEKIWTLYN